VEAKVVRPRRSCHFSK